MNLRLIGGFLAVALVGWAAGIAGLVAFVNWFSETSRAGGDVLGWASWIFLLVGLCATFGFLASAAFAVVDWVRNGA